MKLIRKVSDMFTRDGQPSPQEPDISINSAGIAAPHILDARAGVGYLAGQLLVATPVINGGCFQKSVIYLFTHNADGATGVIINQPLELISYSTLLENAQLPSHVADRELPVYFGGPVERARGFVVHSGDYQRNFNLARFGELGVTSSATILSEIVEGSGPKDAILAVGHAGWAAGQLEAEIEQNSWITVPATPQLLFHTDNELKWATASKSLGVDMAFYSTTVGHA